MRQLRKFAQQFNTTGKSVKNLVHVVRSPHGWWDVRNEHGNVLLRCVSELQAVEAGRREAESLGAELVIRTHDPTAGHGVRDAATPRLQTLSTEEPARSGAGRQAQPPLVLLVEDSVDLREFYAEYLAYAGFRVVTAINGHEALRLAAHLRPDLILMDLRMPGMDGLEATADLKSTPALSHIPVIAFTADVTPEVAARARSVGCAAFIAKPAVPDDVARKITEVLNAKVRV